MRRHSSDFSTILVNGLSGSSAPILHSYLFLYFHWITDTSSDHRQCLFPLWNSSIPEHRVWNSWVFWRLTSTRPHISLFEQPPNQADRSRSNRCMSHLKIYRKREVGRWAYLSHEPSALEGTTSLRDNRRCVRWTFGLRSLVQWVLDRTDRTLASRMWIGSEMLEADVVRILNHQNFPIPTK